MLVQENLKLFSPGHVSWNQSKQAFFPFETYVLPSQQDYGPNGTSIWNLRIWNFATAIWKVMLSKFPMIGPSCSFWKNTDLIGVSGSTTISNPPCSYPAPHSLSCYVWDAIRLALESSYPDLFCGWTGKWTIDPSSLLIYEILSPRQTFWDFTFRFMVWQFILRVLRYPFVTIILLLGMHVWPQLLGFLHWAYSCDRFTHGA